MLLSVQEGFANTTIAWFVYFWSSVAFGINCSTFVYIHWYYLSVQGRVGEPHSVVLFSTAVQLNVTEFVGRTVRFVNYEKHGMLHMY